MNKNFDKDFVDQNIHSFNLNVEKKHIQVQPHSELRENWTLALPLCGPKGGESLVFDKEQQAMKWTIPVGITGGRGPIGPMGRQGMMGPTGPSGDTTKLDYIYDALIEAGIIDEMK